MGIVASCPNGHRIKVKDELAGRKGICPTCAARFRIPQVKPATDPTICAATADLPVARVVSLDPRVAAKLPTATLVRQPATAEERADPTDFMPDLVPVNEESDASDRVDDATDAPAAAPSPAPKHAALEERPELAWCVAVRGGAPSAPLDAAAMRAWLESAEVSSDHVIWRQDWPEWKPVADVFPDALQPPPLGWP